MSTGWVEASGVRVHLSRREYELLKLFALRKGVVLNKKTLLMLLYHGMDEPSPKIIDVFICHLRKKLAVASPGINYITTICARGMCCAIRLK